eukprot:TRINITY_DN15128_c0_g1::TRINITY_DN15128_c0_g1_i1::g.30716::m.30716 TRINITY_DN15128_c0_g1::TRINITY_DN15128_c0_g1_i1::g.30716  ORF type:complete len:548 (+),score=194.72,sp/P80317/TCPZ_MOUSE/64.19/0.0,Cpn60_TCP1/PF00118.19/7e-158,Spore_GerAC/PF05504.6/0.28 TRINITY_DN15128_c0_g1_i1:46-1644(+)
MAHAVKSLNPNAETVKKGQAIWMNIMAGRGLQDVLKTNLGPKGTFKLLVSGSGDLKITKDGSSLLNEMQIQHPTASLIARTATAQDDISGDGTTSNVLFVGELLKQAGRLYEEGLHPRIICEGYELSKARALEFLDTFKKPFDIKDREVLHNVAKTSLRTKLTPELADLFTDIVVDSVLTIKRPNEAIDLFMVEIMHMEHRAGTESRLVKGLVLDHGARHPDMPKKIKNAYILTCNVSLEYEKTEVTSGFFYSNADDREKFVKSERKMIDERCQQIIDLKNKVCGDDPNKGFVVINQKGIDPLALDLLCKAGILALRRAKRRNMERLQLSCGGVALNSFDELDESALGFAGNVYEQTLGEDKYTFIEDVKDPFSCTILIKGPNKHTIAQLKEAVRDGLRAVKNTIEDGCVLPGAGCFEVACHRHLMQYMDEVPGKVKLAIQAFAEALLVIPKVLAENSGFDPQEIVVNIKDEQKHGKLVGIDVYSGLVMDPLAHGIYDNFTVKRQCVHLATVIATQILLVDEIIKAGKVFKK